MTISPAQFLESLVSSRLLTAEEVREFQVTLPPVLQNTARAMAVELVRRGRLTKYQVLKVLEGKGVGLVLSKYVILDKIGEGGMGSVFRAEHRRMKRPVVIKVLSRSVADKETALRRFQREVEAAAHLTHPNIVTAYDADEEQGVPFLVMEYVEGESLGIIVDRLGPLPIEQSLAILLQAATGLDYAHSKGVVHRDIKPNNLLLDVEGTVKILDMGLACFDRRGLLMGSSRDEITDQGQVLGTVEYMSPEQADDPSHVDRRSDIYSLGCTFFRLLTGEAPYRGSTPVDTLLAHLKQPIPVLGERVSEVGPDVQDLFARMVAKRVPDRFQTMAELARHTERLLHGTPDWHRAHLARLAQKAILQMPGVPTEAADRSTRDEQAAVTRETRPGVPLEVATSGRGGLPVGIDLGTTYSVVACVDNTGRPHTLENLEGERLTPSVLLVDGATVLVGREAAKARRTDVTHVADSVKRDMGLPFYEKPLGGRQFRPEVLQAWILNKVCRDGARRIGQVRQAVITVPAYFDETRRKATEDAGYMAGLEVLDILNEPTAAAIAFACQRGFLQTASEPARAERQILVYDLGGGTFDVTVVRVDKGVFQTLATGGDVRLGGHDWDQRLVDYVAEQFIRQFALDPREDAVAVAQLSFECEEAKRILTGRTQTQLGFEYQGYSLRLPLTRALFEQLTADLLERTRFTTDEVLRASGLRWPDIHHLLLVGGATRMPAVSSMLKGLSGHDPEISLVPDELVAHGAALHAAWVLAKREGRVPPARVLNVNSHSLGLVATDMANKRSQTAILIPRNTVLPAAAKRVFTTNKPNQRSLLLRIVEGESDSPDDCLEIGKVTIRDLPENLPAQTPVEVVFRYESNGRIHVTVRVPGHDSVLTQEIVREQALSREELESWRQQVINSPALG